MKKILLVAALLASATSVFAQKQSEIDGVKAAVAKAVAQTQNEKKAVNPATWMKLGETYLKAYNLPTQNIMLGTTKQELDMMFQEKPIAAPEQVEISGEVFNKLTYANKELFFNQNGQLALVNVTKPILEEDALQGALEAYQKAASLDVKKKNTKKICDGLSAVQKGFTDDAYAAYNFQQIEKASRLFEAAGRASASEPLSAMDTSLFYNAAFTAWASNDLDRAKALFEECASYGYYYTDGEVYAKLADIAGKQQDVEAQQNYLEQGFLAYPQSQSILVSLINFYIGKGDSQDRIFELLKSAQQNEPTNVSLYYVEGNIHVQMKHYDEAIASYNKCHEINPASEYGYVGIGTMYYDRGYQTALEADELPANEWKKYDALVEKFAADWAACVEPFEKAFELSKDDNIKLYCAERLKNVTFRNRSKSSEMAEKYEKYNAYFQQATQNN